VTSGRHVVVRNIERPDPEVVAGLREAGVATTHEAAGRTGLAGPALKPLQQGVAIAGPAVTVLSAAGDNLLVHAAVEVCQPGDVLVVTTDAPSHHGMLGDLLATSLQARGVVGLVITAGVRDAKELRAMSFPVWSGFVHAEGTVKASPGSVNVPVDLEGQRVEPGDVVIADDDGVMVVPRDAAESVLEKARARTANEDDKRKQLASGVLGVDMYDLRPLIAELGVEYVDEAP
jgi:4-hydroxy-4-methyl-2-oxoglutarate aldolase